MKKFILLFLAFLPITVVGQQVIPLYPAEVPNNLTTGSDTDPRPGFIRKVITPTLEIYRPDESNATNAAVIICPGGGYSVLVFEGEGVGAAKEFARNGVTAFVLKYRLPEDTLQVNKTIAPLQDAQQAIKLVRERAGEWGLDGDKIGIMGFSAGGHLASTAATHFDEVHINNPEETSVRPDFQILIYPVISMQDELTHQGSKNELLGENPSQEIVDLYSNDLQVTENTPPAYITHSGDDGLVVVENSIRYYEELLKNKVATELHLYPTGDHGFVLREPIEEWTLPIFRWMISMEVIPESKTN
tara:strand:- start:1584 stop:2489 length:906 start_codon:yes stop_codon:yes gene_type:complete